MDEDFKIRKTSKIKELREWASQSQENLNRLMEMTKLERDREILSMRFKEGDEHTLEEVGRHFDISKEHVRQIESNAFNILRSLLHTI